MKAAIAIYQAEFAGTIVMLAGKDITHYCIQAFIILKLHASKIGNNIAMTKAGVGVIMGCIVLIFNASSSLARVNL